MIRGCTWQWTRNHLSNNEHLTYSVNQRVLWGTHQGLLKAPHLAPWCYSSDSFSCSGAWKDTCWSLWWCLSIATHPWHSTIEVVHIPYFLSAHFCLLVPALVKLSSLQRQRWQEQRWLWTSLFYLKEITKGDDIFSETGIIINMCRILN